MHWTTELMGYIALLGKQIIGLMRYRTIGRMDYC